MLKELGEPYSMPVGVRALDHTALWLPLGLKNFDHSTYVTDERRPGVHLPTVVTTGIPGNLQDSDDGKLRDVGHDA
jgi:hypothetical protein